MNLNKNLIAVLVTIALTGCGGGGGGGSSAAPVGSTPTPTTPTTPTSPSTPSTPSTPTNPAPAPTATNATDPYTGQPASGIATTIVTGVVVNDVTVGAVVKAYDLKPDGSNGALLGTSSATGADGKFVIQFATPPTGMVRFVATGGSFKSEADGSTQANTTTELVAPFVTSDLLYFVITPATHIVSHLVSVKAQAGAPLTSAYTASVNTVLGLSAPNVILKDDPRAGVNMLKTVPGSASDSLHTYQDLLTAIEWFGVRYDLPSSVVVKALAANAEKDFPFAGVNGKDVPINVGKWVNGTFDETVAVTLDEVTAVRSPDGSVMYAQNGTIVHIPVKPYISTDLIQYFYRDASCKDDSAKPALLLRYPGDAAVFADATLKSAVCGASAQALADLKARIATNQRSK